MYINMYVCKRTHTHIQLETNEYPLLWCTHFLEIMKRDMLATLTGERERRGSVRRTDHMDLWCIGIKRRRGKEERMMIHYHGNIDLSSPLPLLPLCCPCGKNGMRDECM